MKAAVLRDFGKALQFGDFPDPVAGPGERVVTVKASALHNQAKQWATGAQYGGYKDLPVVVGVDGVGVLEDGTSAARLPMVLISCGWRLAVRSTWSLCTAKTSPLFGAPRL